MAPTDSSSTSRWRRNRSSANLLDQNLQSTPSTGNMMNFLKPAPKLERTPSSRMSLFSLFSKPKVEKARGHTEVGLAVPMQPPEPPTPTPPPLPPKSSLRLDPSPPPQEVRRIRSSQFIRPMSMRPPNAQKPPGSDEWDPPPLFQAYPQSIKYATVQACVHSPDVLMRTQSQRRQAESLRERMDSQRDLTAAPESATEPRKLEKTHRRLDSILSSTPQLTTKVYVLVTSGHILQYAGDGPFDRLPERVLRLGRDSAAFASDLIPGKHWVLQIVQSANEDGTVSAAPKHSLLSRLRFPSAARKEALSFLLVMESAEEMESWMTTVRKEIETLGGMKASSESSRASSSTDGASEKSPSMERPYQRQPVKRNSSRLSTITPVDSPLQSPYSESPKIVASEWEGDRKQKTISIVDSVSTHRQSTEAPSIATTALSHEQLQLDQLRERSRYSYVSTATSVSGPGTRNTSRDPSPTPPSPLKEGFAPAEVEPRRSETSLRSFHMHPGNSSTRRRSMQPLPVTNEDGSVPAHNARTPKRHSIYGPTSPTTSEPKKPELGASIPPSVLVSAAAPAAAPRDASRTNAVVPVPPRSALRSSSAPPSRISDISPPPRAPLPTPPTSRPQSSVIGSLSTSAAALPTPTDRRVSATPKLFVRPLPVRPQLQISSDGSYVLPRRISHSPGNKPARLPLGVVVNRSVTAPVRPPSATSSPATQLRQVNTLPSLSGQPLRRPTSVQIRSDPAPFLSSSRPARPVSNTPSFIPGNRTSLPLHQSPSVPVLRGHGEQLAPPKELAPQRSMPSIGLPPPAPPPNMPLPPPPPVTV